MSSIPTPAEAAAALAALNHNLDISSGPMMIATWVNSMLVMIEVLLLRRWSLTLFVLCLNSISYILNASLTRVILNTLLDRIFRGPARLAQQQLQ